MSSAAPFDLLLVEPSTLLRRTVSLTLRSLGTAGVMEAAGYPTASEFCKQHRYHGAVIALDWPPQDGPSEGLSLVQRIRSGECATDAAIPIAVLVDSCNAELLQVLGQSRISRVLIKPFRARDVIDTVEGMKKRAGTPA